MADIYLTDKDDKYTVEKTNEWVTVRALAGNDTITLLSNANVLAGPGNDTIIDKTGNIYSAAVYWDSPGPIDANLQTGVVKDGWGTTDTLIGIRNIHTSGRDGDRVQGSSQDDLTWINGFWQAGDTWVDLGAGMDQVTLKGQLSDFQYTISADGRHLTLSRNNYTAHIANVESIQFWNDPGNTQYNVADLINFATVGPSTLIASTANAWSSGGRGMNLSYSFMTAVPKYGGNEGGTGFVAPNASYQQAVRSILGQLAQNTGLTFTEVTDSDNSQLRFAANQQSATKGYSFTALAANGLKAGDVWMDIESIADLSPGSEGWQALLHEIGHALGLSHPVAESDASAPVVLLNRWNNNAYTVMSENNSASGLWQSWYGVLDLQALQSLYGSTSSSQHAGSDTYTLGDATGRQLSTLSDAGGHDTIDASKVSRGVYIDLTPGHFSSVGVTPSGNTSLDNLFMDGSTLIEDVIGTPWDDVLLGNGADNIFSPGTGNNTIDGAGGFNVVRMTVPRADCAISVDAATGHVIVQAVDGASGTNDMQNIRRLAFKDCAVALDMDTKGGPVAKILGAVFGKAAISNREYAGIGVYYMDHGATPQSLMDLALQVRLGAGYSVESEVKLFFDTLLGRAPSAAELAEYSNLVTQGALSTNGLAWLAANTGLNAANIGLTGLMQTGLDYAPLGGTLV